MKVKTDKKLDKETLERMDNQSRRLLANYELEKMLK